MTKKIKMVIMNTKKHPFILNSFLLFSCKQIIYCNRLLSLPEDVLSGVRNARNRDSIQQREASGDQESSGQALK